MSKFREQRYYGYLKTCSYKRAVHPFFQDGQVVQLEAIRNIQLVRPEKVPQGVTYLHHITRTVSDLDIHYNGRLHGGFSRAKVMEFINTSDATDFWVKSLSVQVTNDEVRKAAAKLLMDAGIPADSISLTENYVAEFEGNPCRRYSNEGKAPEWVEKIKEAPTEEDKECGFEPATLDLISVLPADVWHDTQGKKRIARAFEREIERMKNALNVHEDANFTKKVITSFVPRASGLVGGREEVLSAEKKWIIKDFE